MHGCHVLISDNDADEEYTKEELMYMCEQVHTCFEMKRKECKELRKKIKSLEQSFDGCLS